MMSDSRKGIFGIPRRDPSKRQKPDSFFSDERIHLIGNRAPILNPVRLCVPARSQANARADLLPTYMMMLLNPQEGKPTRIFLSGLLCEKPDGAKGAGVRRDICYF